VRDDLEKQCVGMAIDAGVAAGPPDAAYANADRVRGLVHEALLESGLGRGHQDRPLADLIEPGMSVLLKPNWVCHSNSAGYGLECLYTHPAFVLAALDEVLRARPGRIVIGDAPIQSCDFDLVATARFREQAAAMAAAAGATLEVVDFRRTVVRRGGLAAGVETDRRNASQYVLIDLGKDSLLEPLSSAPERFRVTNYDPDTLSQSHAAGRHRYLLCREAFECNVILSLPKLKLHRKAGLTGALKNLVGMNGNKDYLPHHRLGGTGSGGDCYPGRSIGKRIAEFLLDGANRRIGTPAYDRWVRWGMRLKCLTTRPDEGDLEGSWHGNDTCWRMVLDLNRALLYGKPDATMADTPRRLLSLTDAIVCGQGEGPLEPSPLVVGAVTFSTSAAAADAIHANLLKLDDQRIPLIRESFVNFRWPLAPPGAVPEACVRSRRLSCRAVCDELGVAAKPPRGWAGHIERR